MKKGGGARRSIKLLIISSLLTILGFSAVCVSVMLDMRRSEEEIARQAGENLASSIEADISRNIEVYDLSLRAVVNNLASPEIDGVSRELRHLILFDHAATAKHFGAIQVFAASGRLTIDSASLDPLPTSAADEEFFTVHRDSRDRGLFISKPMLHRGAYSVILSRRLNDTNGQFAGIVAGAIRFSYFHDLFGRLRLNENDSITVVRRDGIVIMRTPFDLDFVGRDVRNGAVAARAISEPSGSMWGPSPFDGISRLFVWSSSIDKPFVVILGKPHSSIYAAWNKQARWIGGIMSALVLFVGLMTLFWVREIKRRARAEASLRAMATTDGLTGLSNRRKFDQEIDLEWRRAARSFEAVTLMMIDVDHFKAFNDRHGHPEGDKALQAVATCIAQFAKRPGDCAARYGGEEFALLLPGMKMRDALRVAEALRESAATCLDQPAPVTISIGVATLPGDGRSAPSVLVEMADRALYEAKRGGRNRAYVANGTVKTKAA